MVSEAPELGSGAGDVPCWKGLRGLMAFQGHDRHHQGLAADGRLDGSQPCQAEFSGDTGPDQVPGVEETAEAVSMFYVFHVFAFPGSKGTPYFRVW